MEGELTTLLGSTYSAVAPLQPLRPLLRPRASSRQTAVDIFGADEFRMYCYKIVPCTDKGPHDWATCGFCHPGEKATRRCPQKYAYAAIACPDVKTAGVCPRGEACMFSHNVFEYWLHPTRYRTQMCSYGEDCKRSTCFFAHNLSERRANDQLPELQALEREVDTDVGFGYYAGARTACAAGPRFPPFNQAQQHSRAAGFTPRHHQGEFIFSRLASMPHGVGQHGPVQPPAAPTLAADDIDAQMAAAVKLLADLTAAKQQQLQQQQQQQQQQLQQQQAVVGSSDRLSAPPAASSSGRRLSEAAFSSQAAPASPQLRATSSVPEPQPAPSPSPSPNLGSPLASIDLQAALKSLIPELLKHLSEAGSLAALVSSPSRGGAPPAVVAPSPSSPPCALSSESLAALTVTPLKPASSHEQNLGPKFAAASASSSPVDVLSVPSTVASASPKSSVSHSPRASDGSHSPAPSHHGDDFDEHQAVRSLWAGSFGTGMGLDIGLGTLHGYPLSMDSSTEGANGGLADGCGSCSDAMLSSGSLLLESLSQLAEEPSTEEMLPSIQELDRQLRQLSLKRGLGA